MHKNKVIQELTPYLTLGAEFAFSILMFVLLGIWLDGYFETSNVFTIGFLLFSVIGGFVRIFFKITHLGKKNDGNNTGNNSPSN